MLAVMLAVAVAGMVPPTASTADVSAAEFSAERAFAHVEVIAADPRPMGSLEIEETRQYLIGELRSLGLEPELQTISVRDYYGGNRPVPVVNIIARIAGTDSSGAIVLIAHYDTVPTTAGANDNGTAVGAVLETARAVLSGRRPANDVIVLFTDGEEPAPRFGSTAFVETHPLAHDVRLVVNLEAIGGSGASEMIEVVGNEGALISHYASAVSHPSASSALDDIVELIGGSNTDIAPFRDTGNVAAFEFAYLHGSPIYHTPADDLASVHLGSVQHHGTQALGLVRHFGDTDLTGLDCCGQEVFFTILGRTVVHYPAALGVALMLVACLLLAGAMWSEARSGRLAVRRALAGAGVLMAVAIGTGIVVAVVWRILVGSLWGNGGPGGSAAAIWMGISTVIAAGSTAMLWRRLERRFGDSEIEWGGVTLWWLMALLTSLMVPGMGYLFVWPVLAAVFVSGFRSNVRWARLVSLAVVAGAGIVLSFPVMDFFFQMAQPRPGNADSQIPEIILVMGFIVSLLTMLLIPRMRGARTPDAPGGV
ncbi:M28 family peptidase [bacterium]|nr:M28 family peptidase [bacterium]